MLTIGIFPNLKKKSVITNLNSIIKLLTEKNIKIFMPSEAAVQMGFADLACSEKELRERIDIAISIGGDGTLLSAARKIASAAIPIFGINMGRLGFLTEVEVPEMSVYLERLIHGEYTVENRLMLDAYVIKGAETEFVSSALNDIVVTKAGYSRMIELMLEVNCHTAANFSADGLIIATPTGSTGYSLSAGGPIVKSELDVILITPICPHTLYSRPLIVSAGERIIVTTASAASDIVLTIDGQIVEKIEAADKVLIRKSPYSAGFVQFSDKNYYQTLRNKLWRDD